MAEVKSEGQAKQDTLDGSVTIQKGSNQQLMFDSETGCYQLLLGKLPDGNYAFLITKPGDDIFDALENEG